jgi:hypothetical protein
MGMSEVVAAVEHVVPNITDDKLVKVYRKIRTARAAASREYKAKDEELKAQLALIENTILGRLNERGATSTKTNEGTAFRVENLTSNIADDGPFFGFCIETKDLNFFQRRISIEHLKAYMKKNQGNLPPGLNIFREYGVNVRAPGKGGGTSEPPEVEGFESNGQQE